MAKFGPGNQAAKGHGRPSGNAFSTALRQVVTQDDFRKVVKTMLEQALAGDVAAAGVIVNRLVPTLKPASEPIPISLPEGTLAEQALAVVRAIADGVIAPSDGKTVMDALQAAAALGQLGDVERRLAALEKARG